MGIANRVNKLRITLTCFLAYFVMSAVISPLGIVTGPISGHYDIPVTTATAGFSYLTAGILVGTLVSLVIFDLLRLKHIVLSCSALACVSLACIYLVDSYLLFPVWLFLVGLACGVNMTAAIVVITSIYNSRLRASMMLLTDSFYSMAGVLSTWLAGKFILHQLHWGSAYLLAFSMTLVTICIAWFSSFPSTPRREARHPDDSAGKYWPVEIFLVGAAILIYLTGFVTIYSWIPNFTQRALQPGCRCGRRIGQPLVPGHVYRPTDHVLSGAQVCTNPDYLYRCCTRYAVEFQFMERRFSLPLDYLYVCPGTGNRRLAETGHRVRHHVNVGADSQDDQFSDIQFGPGHHHCAGPQRGHRGKIRYDGRAALYQFVLLCDDFTAGHGVCVTKANNGNGGSSR